MYWIKFKQDHTVIRVSGSNEHEFTYKKDEVYMAHGKYKTSHGDTRYTITNETGLRDSVTQIEVTELDGAEKELAEMLFAS